MEEPSRAQSTAITETFTLTCACNSVNCDVCVTENVRQKIISMYKIYPIIDIDNNKRIVCRIAKLLKMSQPLIHKVITKFRKMLFGRRNTSKKRPHTFVPARKHSTINTSSNLNTLETCTLKREVLNCKPPHIVRTFKHCCDSFRHKIQPKQLITALIETGITWQRITHRMNKRSRIILYENECVRIKRMQYIREIQKFRRNGKNIIYINELNPVTSDDTATKALIVAAASANGPLDSVYMQKLTVRNFLKWITNRILAKLDEPAVIVMKAATVFRYEKLSAVPAEYDSRQSMIAWLQTQQIEYNDACYKPELYELIRTNEQQAQDLSIDAKLQEKGHQLIYIPVDQADLDPFELIWTTVKIKMMASGFISFNMNREFMTIERDVWKEHFDRIINVENQYIDIERNLDRTNALYQFDTNNVN